MKNGIPVIVEIQNSNNIIVLNGILKEIPTYNRDIQHFNVHGGPSMYLPGVGRWGNVELYFSEDIKDKQDLLLKWINDSYYSSINTIDNNVLKSNIILKLLKNPELRAVNLLGAYMSSVNINYYPQESIKIANNNTYVKQILFEKIGNIIQEIEFHIILNIDYAVMDF